MLSRSGAGTVPGGLPCPSKFPEEQKAAGCVNFSDTQSGTDIFPEYRQFG